MEPYRKGVGARYGTGTALCPEKVEPRRRKTINILLASPLQQDQISLNCLLERSIWRVRTVGTCREAHSLLAATEIPVMICAQDLPDGSWRDFLSSDQYRRPSIIVTSARADNSLWSEALERGGVDVLARPFARHEVIWSLSLAWRNWADRHHDPPAGSRDSGELEEARQHVHESYSDDLPDS